MQPTNVYGRNRNGCADEHTHTHTLQQNSHKHITILSGDARSLVEHMQIATRDTHLRGVHVVHHVPPMQLDGDEGAEVDALADDEVALHEEHQLHQLVRQLLGVRPWAGARRAVWMCGHPLPRPRA